MYLIFKVFSFLLVHQSVCQICNETRSIFREVPETYRFTFIETYEPCIIFCSVKTRKAVNVTTRIVQRFENVTLNVCCDGYVEDNNHVGNGLYCNPVCNPPCHNGYCRRPNQCACEAGYALDPLDPHVCKPLCLEGCKSPDCISTKTPQCFSGNNSEPITNSQAPVCTEPCVNGKCVGLEICKCFPGYHQTSTYNCEPSSYFATESCEHGTLIDPYTCLCDQGWQWKCGSCEPICDICDHGTCMSPGQCKCNRGYTLENGRCIPHCTNGCANGRCVSPELCSCNSGWYKTKEGECKAHCDVNCEHGVCVAPNVCDCNIGYQLYINKEISRCVPNRKDCEGSTSNLEDCKCEAPYEVIYFADNGGNCDCIGACLNSSSRCTNATCLFMNAAFDMSPPELDYDHNIDENFHENPIVNEPATKEGEFSTVPTVEIHENTERNNDVVTLPELNYDYDSEEEDSDELISDAGTPGTKSNETSTLPTIEGNENTAKINTTIPSPEINDGRNEETHEILIQEVHIKYDESTLPIVGTKEIIEGKDVTKTESNSDAATTKRETVKLSDHYWIIGIVVIGVLVTLIILGVIVKRKCLKKHSLKSSGGTEDDIVVHYTNKIS